MPERPLIAITARRWPSCPITCARSMTISHRLGDGRTCPHTCAMAHGPRPFEPLSPLRGGRISIPTPMRNYRTGGSGPIGSSSSHLRHMDDAFEEDRRWRSRHTAGSCDPPKFGWSYDPQSALQEQAGERSVLGVLRHNRYNSPPSNVTVSLDQAATDPPFSSSTINKLRPMAHEIEARGQISHNAISSAHAAAHHPDLTAILLSS